MSAGDQGADRLSGGYGADQFIVVRGSGPDSITDLDVRQDALSCAGSGDHAALLRDAHAAAARRSWTFGNGDTVMLQHVTLHALTEAWGPSDARG